MAAVSGWSVTSAT